MRIPLVAFDEATRRQHRPRRPATLRALLWGLGGGQRVGGGLESYAHRGVRHIGPRTTGQSPLTEVCGGAQVVQVRSDANERDAPSLGVESARLDAIWAAPPRSLDAESRQRLWASAGSILSHGPVNGAAASASTGLALGYVQSGKTTAITALFAAAADHGYRVIVALLGSTNLLLDQNTSRIESELGIGTRSDYRWVAM